MASFVRNYCPCKNVISLSQRRVIRPVAHGGGGRTVLTRNCTSQAQSQEFLPDGESSTSSSQPPMRIEIPKKVKRDSLSVLQALESTVKRSSSVPHYSLIDDPYLYGHSLNEKRQNLYSRYSGKKAARYAAQRYPELFQVNPLSPWMNMDSILKAFTKTTPRKGPIASLDGLKERIRQRLPVNAYNSYQAVLKADTEPVPEEVVLDLLDLLCVHNSTEVPVTEHLGQEERIASIPNRYEPLYRLSPKKTWKDDGLAEKLYESMESPSPRAQCSILRGRAKYIQAEGAYRLYQKMVANNTPIDRGTYSEVIYMLPYYFRDSADQWSNIAEEILQHMKDNNVRPDVHIFNAVIRDAFFCKRKYGQRELAYKALNEMRALGIEPTASTWLYFMKIMGGMKDHGRRNKIFSEMEGTEFTVQHSDDCLFFREVMMMCKRNSDWKGAEKLDALLYTGHNINLLDSLVAINDFYKLYFDMLLERSQVDLLTALYEKVVPHTYVLNKHGVSDIMEGLVKHVNYTLLFRLWDDYMNQILMEPDNFRLFLVLLSQAPKEEVSSSFLEIVDYLIRTFLKEEEKMKADAADGRDARRPRVAVNLDGKLIGYIVEVYLNGAKYEEAWEAFNIYCLRKKKMPRYPGDETLVRLVQRAVKEDNFEHLMLALRVLDDVGYTEMEELIEKTQTMTLTDEQGAQLQALV